MFREQLLLLPLTASPRVLYLSLQSTKEDMHGPGVLTWSMQAVEVLQREAKDSTPASEASVRSSRTSILSSAFHNFASAMARLVRGAVCCGVAQRWSVYGQWPIRSGTETRTWSHTAHSQTEQRQRRAVQALPRGQLGQFGPIACTSGALPGTARGPAPGANTATAQPPSATAQPPANALPPQCQGCSPARQFVSGRPSANCAKPPDRPSAAPPASHGPACHRQNNTPTHLQRCTSTAPWRPLPQASGAEPLLGSRTGVSAGPPLPWTRSKAI
jgi:hypothetical protein